ncbi:MAG: carbamoyltransferase HypF, partial [Bacillota bacterium]|nr:carbamoyltransferase HypF [Bacillota bacterium]
MKTVLIRIWGIVQGVGFRPFIAKLADKCCIKGNVRNIGGLVDITLTATPENINTFVERIKKEKPEPAEIVHIKVEDIPYQEFSDFLIINSGEGDDEASMIPADLAICPDCLEDLFDQGNPRYRHPFISCMACGPRYTIIDKIPYDRENTAMVDFPMCDFCDGEYTDRQDRRYHAQTISCHNCGPQLLEYKSRLTSEKALAKCIELLKTGGIVALKGVGGYNFLASPFNNDTVLNLRALKGREEKPFAVMFKDIDNIKFYCRTSLEEEALLTSSARPIVLLDTIRPDLAPETNKTSRYTGAFLPSMGLHHLLIEACGPLIVTSANLADMPMINDDEEMFKLYEENRHLLAAVFYHKRDIRVRVDDSVVRVIDGQPQMVRRSKGYAPVPLYLKGSETIPKDQTILALGGQLKSAFTLSKGNFAYVSQFFGDLDADYIRKIYIENIERMKTLFRIEPKLVVTDSHPLYFSHTYGQEYAEKHEIPLLQVQHHHAHVASVMAEHHIDEAVIGVSFDGTGYGDDGNIWGGEFLLCRGAKFVRMGQLQYVPMLGGDNSMKEGWKSAMCYMAACGGEAEALPLAEDSRYAMVKAAIRHGVNTIYSSSMGRLFDAVAAAAGIHDENRYEGECAIMLENAAARCREQGVAPYIMTFLFWQEEGVYKISAATVFQAIAKGLALGVSKEALALGFHEAVAKMILSLCEKISKDTGVKKVALTGGVFQNKILMETTLSLLREEDFEIYYNISVGTNDGGI